MPRRKSKQNSSLHGLQRSQIHSQNLTPNNPHIPPPLLPFHDLPPLPRPPRRPPPRRRRLSHRLRQHHRLLRPLRPRHRNGAHLRPSLRGPQIQTPRPHLTKNHSFTSPHINPHLSPMAQHEPNLDPLWAGPRYSHGSSILHSLLPP